MFAGESVQLNCHVSKGDLPLDIKWHFHGFENTSSHLGILTTKMTSRTSFLSIAAATASHSGNYTCVAANSAGSTNHSTVLNVHGQFNLLIASLMSSYVKYITAIRCVQACEWNQHVFHSHAFVKYAFILFCHQFVLTFHQLNLFHTVTPNISI